jgi:hypothetical protein
LALVRVRVRVRVRVKVGVKVWVWVRVRVRVRVRVGVGVRVRVRVRVKVRVRVRVCLRASVSTAPSSASMTLRIVRSSMSDGTSSLDTSSRIAARSAGPRCLTSLATRAIIPPFHRGGPVFFFLSRVGPDGGLLR